MDSRTSPGHFLAQLLVENNLTVKSLCQKSGLKEYDVCLVLSDHKIITPSLADKLGSIFYSPKFWIIKQAMWQLRCEGFLNCDDNDINTS